MVRTRFVFILSLFSATLPICALAQELPRETPRTISILGQRIPGEARLHLTQDQLEGIGIPEIAYSQSDRHVADLSEMGLIMTRTEDRVEGLMRTALGDLSFRTTVQHNATIRVEFELPETQDILALNVDRANFRAEVEYPEGFVMTVANRFLFRSLAVALATKVGDRTTMTDTLLRASNLWGAHPIAPVRLGRIAPPREKSWTNLCGTTSASLAHDATTHALLSETLATGPGSDQCRARCGAGCTAIFGTSAWTVHCGEHDRCVQTHGDNNGPNCGDEFNSASDDYLFAPNCNLAGW